MELEDLLIENSEQTVFENDYMRVIKVLEEIPVGKNYSKRIQLVIWKKKETDIPDLDIRLFDSKNNRYLKGITLSIKESIDLYTALNKLLKDKIM
jgi:hypothetical protein